jgi:ankyrin repeat protein
LWIWPKSDYQKIMKLKFLAAVGFTVVCLQSNAANAGIFAAAASGDTSALQKYIVADPKSIAATNDTGRTPLCVAAISGQAEAVHFLISRGADVNAKGFEEMTPLADLAADGTTNDDACSEVATVLVEHGAEINAEDASHETPLMHAVETRKSEMARVLIGHDASLTDKYRGVNKGMTVLHMAIANNDPDMVKVLLEFSEPLNAINKQGETPLQFAEERDETEIAATLRAASPAEQQDAVPPTREELRVIARRIVAGEPGAFDDLEKMADKLYDGINYQSEKPRVMLNLDRMNAAYKILGAEAGKGNDAALQALKKSLAIKNLSGFAKNALTAAAKENPKAKTMLEQ